MACDVQYDIVRCWHCQTHYFLETTMYCPKCQGFGFYSVTRADGTREGRKCEHKIPQKFVLLQDREQESPLIRTHSERPV